MASSAAWTARCSAACKREDLIGSIPETLFAMFQMTFAIITPALVIGGYAERIRFSAVLWFSALWLLLVYVPVAHWVWGGGWLAKRGVMDFAGGIVVHVNAGVAALVCALVIGRRRGFPHVAMAPHSLPLAACGAGMLWVGWFGFNGGSALAANGTATDGGADHAPGRLGRCLRVDAGGVAALRQTQPAGRDHRHGGRPRHHHAGLGFRRAGRCAGHRLRRGRGVLHVPRSC